MSELKSNQGRVLHITLGGKGGLGTIVESLLKNLARFSQRIIFLSHSVVNQISSSVEVCDPPQLVSFKKEIIFANIWRYLLIMKSSDIIHIHHCKFWLLTSPLFIFSKKNIYSFHTSFGSGIHKNIVKDFLIFTIINYCLLFSRRIIFLTQGQREYLRSYAIFKKEFSEKALVINNFISSSLILEKVKNKREGVLFVGRYSQLKGFNDLLQVAEDLESVNFYLVGDNNLEVKLSNLHNVGSIKYSDMKKEYDKHPIFILPSYTEAFPMTVLEAMARGLVILISDIPGMRNIVKEGRNGYLFKPGDTEKIKEIIEFLHKNPSEIKRISENNLKDIWNFIEEKQIPKYEKIYKEIIRQNL